MIIKTLFSILIINIIICEKGNTNFVAMVDMEDLIRTQFKVIGALKLFMVEQEQLLRILKIHLDRFEMDHKNAMKDITKYVGNPINGYTLIKRLTTDLDFIQKTIDRKRNFTIEENIKYPSHEDLKNVKERFLNLQSTYRLNTTDLAKGILNYVAHSNHGKLGSEIKGVVPPMSVADCYDLGLLSFDKEEYALSTAWFLEALDKYNDGEADAYNITDLEIFDRLENSYRMFGDFDNCAKLYEMVIAPIPETYEWVVKNYRKLADGEIMNTFNSEDIELSELQMTATMKPLKHNNMDSRKVRLVYNALCRGKQNMIKYTFKNLSCYYVTGSDPFLILARIKAEELHASPSITLFHDIVSDDEIRIIQQVTKLKLIQGLQTANHVVITDEESKVAERLTRRVGHFTGLNMSLAEPLQASLHLVGHYYTPFDDYVSNFGFFRNGDRMATIHFYLSDVQFGGATVFVDLGLAVNPTKGSALFWRNQLPSGKIDLSTMHGSCPVLYGSKWVAAKWIHNPHRELFKRI